MRLQDIEDKIADGKKLNDEEEEFLVGKVDTIWDSHPDVTTRFPRWRKYIAWVAGYQLFDYNRVSKKLVEVPIDRDRKLTINKLKPYVRTLLAKLTADVPQMSIIPNTNEDDDIRAARIGDKVIDGLSEKLGFDQTLNNIKLWTIICNRAFIRVFWNEDDHGILGYRVPPAGTSEPNPPPPDVLSGETDIEPAAATDPVLESGDVCIECVSPFNCRVDPLYFEHDKWRWFVFGDEVDADALEDEYELERGELKEGSQTLGTAFDLELQDEQEIAFSSSSTDEEKVVGRTVVKKEYWTPKVWARIAGKKVLEYGKNDEGIIPFWAIEDRLIPISNYEKEFTYNESLVKDAIPVQREYNRMASIMSLALDRASKLKVLTPIGALLSKKQFVNDYGVFIDYNRNAGDPYQMKLEPFPMEMPQYKSDLEREMMSIMSLGPASFGQLPERASHASGTLVNILLEQDDVILNPLLNHINNVIGKAWSLAMKLVQDNYSVSRLVKIVGDDGQDDVLKFQGAQLMGNTDVKVVSQTGLPRSRALRIEYIMKLREVGLLKDDRSTLEMLEFGNADRIFKDDLIHERKAYRENSSIVANANIQPKGTVGWVYAFEDHATHMKIHLRERLGVRFERLLDNQKGALDIHIQATLLAMAPPPEPVVQDNEQQGKVPPGQPGPTATPPPTM